MFPASWKLSISENKIKILILRCCYKNFQESDLIYNDAATQGSSEAWGIFCINILFHNIWVIENKIAYQTELNSPQRTDPNIKGHFMIIPQHVSRQDTGQLGISTGFSDYTLKIS